MAEFQHSILVEADARAVFDFVADVRNMPAYLPTTKSAQPQGEERVRLQGEANHRRYDADGYIRCNVDQLRMEWGADEHYYSGRLQVDPRDNGSEVTVHLSFRGRPRSGEDRQGPTDEEIQEGLVKALESIRNLVTKQGGKVEPEAATAATAD